MTQEVDGRPSTRSSSTPPSAASSSTQPIPQDLGYVDRSDRRDDMFELEIDLPGRQEAAGPDRRPLLPQRTAPPRPPRCSTTSRRRASSTPPRGAITVAVCGRRSSRRRRQQHAGRGRASRSPRSSTQYSRGLISDDERYDRVVRRSGPRPPTRSPDAAAPMKRLTPFNPIFMMADSGARGSINQIRQLAGMRGLMANPSGKTIELPIQRQLPRGPDGSGVLHLLPRRPQGPGRHGPAYRRLGLPDPPPGGRLPGRDRPRGRLLRHPRRACPRHHDQRHHATASEMIEKPGRTACAGRFAAEDIVDPETGEVHRAAATRLIDRRSGREASWRPGIDQVSRSAAC